MEDRLVRAFVAVAEHGTFGAAARALAVTQPALTKQIQALEARIGGALFRRGRLGARLTPLGRTLLPDARDVVERLDAFELRAKRLTAGGAGRLSLGFGLSTIDFAPRAVAEFRRRNPDVGVTLDDMATAVQLERLRRGQLDAGFVRLPVGDRGGVGRRGVGGGVGGVLGGDAGVGGWGVVSGSVCAGLSASTAAEAADVIEAAAAAR